MTDLRNKVTFLWNVKKMLKMLKNVKKKKNTECWKPHKGQPLSLPILFSNASRMKLESIL